MASRQVGSNLIPALTFGRHDDNDDTILMMFGMRMAMA